MKLDAITARVRLRPGIRATDFGVALARRWWTTYMPAWCLITLPFFLAGAAFIYFGTFSPLLVLFGLWWLKPLWDRSILFVLSRSFFGEEMTLNKVLAFTVRSWIRWPALLQITFLRVIPIRGTFDPVLELERPRFRAAFKRYSNLLGGFDGHGLFLATTMEWVFIGSAFAVLAMVMPETLEYDVGMVSEAIFGDIDNPALATLAVPLYWVALSFVEPFFVATGFACYINRRVELEGWDIELTFRRLADRLNRRTSERFESAARNVGMALLAAAFAAATMLAPAPVHAQEDGDVEPVAEYEEEPRGYYDENGNWVWAEGDETADELADTPVRDIKEGHYDADGDWIDGPGFYNDTGEWVDVQGYFDADGNFVEEAVETSEPREVDAQGRYERTIEDPEVTVTEILSDPVFGEKVTEEVWRLKDQNPDVEPEDPAKPGAWVGILAAILEVFAYLIIAAILGGLIYLIVKRFGTFGGDAKVSRSKETSAMVLPDGRRVAVPEDWLEMVLVRWDEGDRIMALSLFYRGVLRDLKEAHGIKVPDSATSRETVRIVKRGGGPHSLVRDIASLWTREVYAGRGPGRAEVQRALEAYRQHLALGGER